MAYSLRGQISRMVRDVEKAAKQIRKEVRKATPKNLDDAASRLRSGAAEAAHQVERYIRELRMELESGTRRSSAKRTVKKRAAKKRTVKKRAAKKRTVKKRSAKKGTAKRRTAKRSTKKTARKRG